MKEERNFSAMFELIGRKCFLQCIGLILGRENVNILDANLPFPVTGESWHLALSCASPSRYEDSKSSAIAGCVASVSLVLHLPLLLEMEMEIDDWRQRAANTTQTQRIRGYPEQGGIEKCRVPGRK